MALLTLGDAADLTDVAIQKIWLKQTDLEKKSYFDKYFHVEKGVTDRLLKDSSLSGFSEASRITENSIITSEAPIQGLNKIVALVKFFLINGEVPCLA